MMHALSEIARASRSVGFEIVVVHAIDPEAVIFYARAGFTRFEDHPLHLFMTVKSLVAAVVICDLICTYEVGTVENSSQEVRMSTASNSKSERLNVRLTTDALETIREAASVQQQDVTSFVLGAALERARAVLAEDRLLRLTPHEVNELEKALDSDPQVVPQLASLFRRFGASRKHEVSN